MNATIFIANGTEDTEFVCTRDLLIRAGIDVRVLSVNNPTVTLSHGLIVLADGLLSDYVSSDILILPGGKKGVNEFLNNDSLINILKKEYKNNKIICAICAAPVVLGKAGLLKNKNENYIGVY